MLRAFSVCLELGDSKLAVELYHSFLVAHQGPLSAATAAELIEMMGDLSRRLRSEEQRAKRTRRERNADVSWPEETAYSPLDLVDLGFTIAASARSEQHAHATQTRTRAAVLADSGAETAPMRADSQRNWKQALLLGCDARVLNTLLGLCASAGAMQPALLVYRAACFEQRCVLEQKPLSQLIDSLIAGERHEEAFAVWERASKGGFRPLNRTLVRLLRAVADGVGDGAGESAQMSLLRRLYSQRLFSEEVGVDVAMVGACAACGRLDEALVFYSEALNAMPTLPTLAATAALDPRSSARSNGSTAPLPSSRSSSKPFESFRGEADAPRPKLNPAPSEGTRLLHAALLACAHVGDGGRAARLLDEAMGCDKRAPDAWAVSIVVRACASSGLMRSAFRLLQRSVAAEIASAPAVLDMLKCCAESHEGVVALQVHDWARGVGLLQGAGGLRQSKAMEHLLTAMLGSERRPSVQLLEAARDSYLSSFTQLAPSIHFRFGRALVLAFARVGRADDALALLRDAESRGELLAPSYHQAEDLLHHLMNIGHLESAKPLFAACREQHSLEWWPQEAYPVRVVDEQMRNAARITEPILPPEQVQDAPVACVPRTPLRRPNSSLILRASTANMLTRANGALHLQRRWSYWQAASYVIAGDSTAEWPLASLELD